MDSWAAWEETHTVRYWEEKGWIVKVWTWSVGSSSFCCFLFGFLFIWYQRVIYNTKYLPLQISSRWTDSPLSWSSFFTRMMQCQQDVDGCSVYSAQFAEAACIRSGRISSSLLSLCIPPPLCLLINRRSKGTDQPNCRHITRSHLRWPGSSQNHFVHH